MGLFNVPRAHATDWAQANCGWNAEYAYNQRNAQITAKEGASSIGAAIDGALSLNTYQKQLGVCRMTGNNVSSFPYRPR